jgi:hypothetical protein
MVVGDWRHSLIRNISESNAHSTWRHGINTLCVALLCNDKAPCNEWDHV